MTRSPWPRWPRWSRMSQVERVEVYTRQSLFILLYGTPLFVLPTRPDPLGGGPAVVAAVLGLTVLVTLAAGWALRDVMDLYPAAGPVPWRSIGVLLATALVAVVAGQLLPGDGGRVLSTATWAACVWGLVGLTDRRLTLALLAGASLLPWVLTGRPAMAAGALGVALFLFFTVRASLWLLGVVVELDRTRAAQGELAVAEERLRFSRDVHDVLGRHLSAIAVQAELAVRLSERDDHAQAAATMLEVREHAHDALREARELARGYRETTLDRELQGARSLLQSAGIATAVDIDGLDPGWHEATAWVVREAVTNVLRHSRAEQVSIRYADGVLEVRNDGATGPASVTGSGLLGLRDRLAASGATLTTELDGREFVVRAALA